MKSQRRQIGGRYLARARGAFRAARDSGLTNCQPGAKRRNTGHRGANGWPPPRSGGPFQGPDSDRRRPRVDLVRRLPS